MKYILMVMSVLSYNPVNVGGNLLTPEPKTTTGWSPAAIYKTVDECKAAGEVWGNPNHNEFLDKFQGLRDNLYRCVPAPE
jgi:hypothetical protein